MLSVPALAHAEAEGPGGTRASILLPVVLRVPSDFFKAGGGLHDESGERWITVHPNGEGTTGTPVKIRESKTQKGVFHVIGGAGGKLNYMKLTGVGSPEEHKAKAKARAAAKRASAKEEAAREVARRDALTPEARAAEDAQAEARAVAKKKATSALEAKRAEFVDKVSKALGWQPSGDDAKDGGRRYRRARAVLEASRQQLLRDRERAGAAVGRLPLSTDDPEAVALTDVLDPPAAPRGKGFQSDTRGASDAQLRATAAAADVGALRAELADAERHVEAADDPDDPVLRARVDDAREQLRMAELIRDAATITPDELGARRGTVRAELSSVSTREEDVVRQLDVERTAYRAAAERDPSLPPPDALTALEQQAHLLALQRTHLQQQMIDLAVMAGESAAPAIAGEQATLRARAQADRETEILAAQGQEGVECYRAALQRAGQARERQQARRRAARSDDAATPVRPVVDPEVVLELLAHDKGIRAMERELAGGDVHDDARLFGSGYFTETGEVTPAARAEAERALVGDVHERATRAFLEAVESPELLLGRGGQFTEQYDQPALYHSLERHLSAGAYNALNTAALASVKTPLLRREVVDVLGAGGAAQLVAHALRQHEDARSLREMAAGLGDYHVAEHVAQAETRIAEMSAALDAADTAMQHLTNPTDLAVAIAANEARQAHLEAARQTMGQALGEYEATAALAHALTEKAPTEIHATLGAVDSETAIRQMRALGLGRDDYEITSDGTNHFATVRRSGFDKLTAPVDAEHLQLTNDVLAIKRGEQDQDGWQPKGTIVRTATTLNAAQGLEPESLTARLKPLSAVGDTGDVRGDVEEHIARRAASGDHLDDIAADLAAKVLDVPAAHRQAFGDALNAILPARMPTTENGKPVMIPVLDTDGAPKLGPDGAPLQTQAHHAVKASAHADRVSALVEAYFRRTGAPSHAPLNAQAIDLDHPETHEAVFRALAHDPRAMVAFAPLGGLGAQARRTLRQYFASEITAKAPKAGKASAAALDARLAELGPEPPRTEKGGLFGGETTSTAWLDWSHRRNAIMEQHHFTGAEPATPDWPSYVTMMGGTSHAYAALQDQLKGRFLQAFHRHYTTLTNQPLRIGTQDIAHAELHTDYLDPAAREQHLAERRRRIDAARNRTADKRYAVGSVAQKLERLANVEAAERQAQGSLLGATPAAARRELGVGERYTLGQRLEEQLQRLMPNVAQHFRPGAPVQLMADKRYDGRFVHQQRAVKAFLRTKRMAMALGTGCVAGDTLMEGRTFYDWWLSGDRPEVTAWDGEQFCRTQASAVFLKGYEPMFDVALASGEVVCVTAAHRFMTGRGWKRLDELSRGDDVLRVRAEMGRAADSPAHCSGDSHRCGARPPSAVAGDPVVLPSRDDAPQHSHGASREDGPADAPSRSHRCSSCDHRATSGFLRQAGAQSDAALLRALVAVRRSSLATPPCAPRSYRWSSGPACRDARSPDRVSGVEAAAVLLVLARAVVARFRVPEGAERSSGGSCQDVRRSRRTECRPSTAGGSGPSADRVSASASEIVSIRPAGQRLVFDVEVPTYHNYVANGIVHHNSGKTSIAIGALSHLRATPGSGVRRGLLLVPSVVQGQFSGELARTVDPKTTRWAANPGGDRGQRLGEHRDADTHAVVHTHQAFRDDMVHVLAQHLGVDEAAATERLMALPRGEASTLMREAWKKAGIDYQMISVDEGHGLLDRDGKPDSVLSRIVQAATDVAPYYMSSSADPVKNDVSELRSLLDKLHPDGRYADAGAWKRRYGVNTTAAAEALQREVAPWVYAAHIPNGNQVNRRTATVPLHPAQAERYAQVMTAVDRLRAARGRGEVDVDAARLLAPERFKAGADVHAIAAEIGRNPGAAKEQALARVIDGAPRGENAKIQHLVASLKDHPTRDKPVVITAHLRSAVREIAEALAEAGHRVETITGSDSAAERDRKRLRFQPERGDPDVDVLVLSDAGEAGLNLQRGQTLIQYDRPPTAKSHAQRNGRIDRLGQRHPEIDLVDLTTDTPYEARAARRIAEKYELRNILTAPGASIDDSGLAAVFNGARRRAAAGDREVA